MISRTAGRGRRPARSSARLVPRASEKAPVRQLRRAPQDRRKRAGVHRSTLRDAVVGASRGDRGCSDPRRRGWRRQRLVHASHIRHHHRGVRSGATPEAQQCPAQRANWFQLARFWSTSSLTSFGRWCPDRAQSRVWWSWDLSFTGHAEMRMEQRGVTEVEVRDAGGSHRVPGQLTRRRDRLRGVPMTERSLQVTYRKGRTFAAYLHLSHPPGRRARGL
jgi:hypothetical protein